MAPAPLARGKKAYQQRPLDNITGVRHEAARLTALDTPQCPGDPAEAVDPNNDSEKPVDKVKRDKNLGNNNKSANTADEVGPDAQSVTQK